MYSIVLMAAVGTGPAAPGADVTPPPVVAPGGLVAGCTGCTGYVVSSGCTGSCYGSGCHGGGLFGHKVRARGGMFGHHNKTSCYGCSGYSCSGYSCFGSSAGCSGCYGSCYGHGYGFGYSCFGSYAGCTGSHGGWGYGCGGVSYPSYSYPYHGGAYVIPVETPVKPADPDAGKTDGKTDGKVDGKAGGKSANLKFRLPAGASLFVDGRATPGDGAERAFFTPALEAGQKYFYDVRAEVVAGGRTVSEDRRVVVEAGAELVVEFPKLVAAAGADSALAGK